MPNREGEAGPVNGRFFGRTVSELTNEDLGNLSPANLMSVAIVLQGVLRMKNLDLAHERVARWRAENNFVGRMMAESDRELKEADRHNREGNVPRVGDPVVHHRVCVCQGTKAGHATGCPCA